MQVFVYCAFELRLRSNLLNVGFQRRQALRADLILLCWPKFYIRSLIFCRSMYVVRQRVDVETYQHLEVSNNEIMELEE